MGRCLIFKKISKKQALLIILAATLALVLIITFTFIPLKDYFKFNSVYASWNERSYEKVKSFNRIDYGIIGSDDYHFKQFGGDVHQTPVLFSKKCLKYLPNTNRWILGAYGEKSTAVCIGMVDCNKQFDFTSENGEYFKRNYVITKVDGTPVEAGMHGNTLYSEINGIIVDSQLRFRVYLPDMSTYDEVTIDLSFA